MEVALDGFEGGRGHREIRLISGDVTIRLRFEGDGEIIFRRDR